MRWKRRELIWRAIRARRALRPIADRTGGLAPDAIIAVATLRNEMAHLREFLAHHRGLGVDHFLVVDNGSTDGSRAFLAAQPDVSLWHCRAGYRDARFGLDWANALLMRHGAGRWCLTLDADELLIYPDHDRRGLRELTAHLDRRGIRGMGAVMLDLYPGGRLGTEDAAPNAPLTERLPWFDPGPWRRRRMMPRRNLWLQGGVRDRVFFADDPARAPTMNKLPLMRWTWRQVYVNSTHSMLPPHLNQLYDGPGDARLSGVLLHAKFAAGIVDRSQEELTRRQHFADPDRYAAYHRAILQRPVLRGPASVRHEGWRQLVDLGIMGTGDWLRPDDH
ncbi:glycosyltransferase family 2 protein [Paracoccus sp. 1_MG-2023]|uniref:glycosyltransferase family 2 protein n=1 Tax=unclassified Paracoccus (in: a-proteobacteria) TaxID=2688777 RepID=UPI0020908D75|nr:MULTISPECIES: glycosyltransferase family 2 protein [unclassified Paracoccus (in: a-proteobacteria)]MDO6669924.1 glycosyltransferase family 2 protein [Paracoccus sp. 1_MG-2023]